MERVVNWWHHRWMPYIMTDQRHPLVYIKRDKTLILLIVHFIKHHFLCIEISFTHALVV